MFHPPLSLRSPGLFVTGTDTEVGKTVATCAVAAVLRRRVARVGVSKPFASGCRHDREGLVSEDAEALAHFADCRLPLHVINPIRFAAPIAPAAAAEKAEQSVDWEALRRGLTAVDEASDVVLIEGVGGLLVPLDPDDQSTVLDLARAIGYPVLVVARSTLGTLNHTAMTVRLLQQAGLHVPGVVMNGYDPDSPDPSTVSNRRWIEKLCGCPVLALLPQCREQNVQPHKAKLDAAIIDAASHVNWLQLARTPK